MHNVFMANIQVLNTKQKFGRTQFNVKRLLPVTVSCPGNASVPVTGLVTVTVPVSILFLLYYYGYYQSMFRILFM